MFRYLGFRWNPADPARSAVARRLDEAIRAARGWESALCSPGLCVYATGCRAGANAIYRLPHGQGVILGRLFRRGEESRATVDASISEDDGRHILQNEGRALIDDYWGRYVAILRNHRHGAHLLRDPGGALPCFRSELEGVAIFYSWLEDLIEFAPVAPPLQVDWDAMAALLSLRRLGGPRTALRGISEVLPGQLTALDAGDASPIALWSAVEIARRSVEPEPAIAAARLRQVVTDCTQAWSSCYDSILFRLSGGVDSAILLGSLSRLGATSKVHCLNYHSPGSNSDERRFARVAAKRAGVDLLERERNATVRLEDFLSVSRTPEPESYIGRMSSGRIDAEVAALHGAPAMFTGAGGDQVLFQLRTTWTAADYMHRHGFGSGLVRASLDAARLGQVSLAQAMWRALLDARRRSSPTDDAGRYTTLARHEALAGTPLDRYVHPDLLRASDLPPGKFCQVQELIDPCGYYDPYLRDAAPEIVNPLLSQPIVELCLALPTWLLTYGGRGRALARRAFADDLPREIASRHAKGGMDEYIEAVHGRNLAFIRSLLLDGQLAARGLLDRAKIEAALAGRLSSTGDFIGEIHDYVAIEAWLQRISASHSHSLAA